MTLFVNSVDPNQAVAGASGKRAKAFPRDKGGFNRKGAVCTGTERNPPARAGGA